MSNKGGDPSLKFALVVDAIFVIAVVYFISSCDMDSARNKYKNDLENGLDKITSGQSLSDAESSAVKDFLEYETKDW